MVALATAAATRAVSSALEPLTVTVNVPDPAVVEALTRSRMSCKVVPLVGNGGAAREHRIAAHETLVAAGGERHGVDGDGIAGDDRPGRDADDGGGRVGGIAQRRHEEHEDGRQQAQTDAARNHVA